MLKEAKNRAGLSQISEVKLSPSGSYDLSPVPSDMQSQSWRRHSTFIPVSSLQESCFIVQFHVLVVASLSLILTTVRKKNWTNKRILFIAKTLSILWISMTTGISVVTDEMLNITETTNGETNLAAPEADSRTNQQDVNRLLRTPNFHYSVHNALPPNLTFNQTNTVHNLTF
jgi:hypothetical protein